MVKVVSGRIFTSFLSTVQNLVLTSLDIAKVNHAGLFSSRFSCYYLCVAEHYVSCSCSPVHLWYFRILIVRNARYSLAIFNSNFSVVLSSTISIMECFCYEQVFRDEFWAVKLWQKNLQKTLHTFSCILECDHRNVVIWYIMFLVCMSSFLE